METNIPLWIASACITWMFSFVAAWQKKEFTRWNAAFCVLGLVPGANVPVALYCLYGLFVVAIEAIKLRMRR